MLRGETRVGLVRKTPFPHQAAVGKKTTNG
jgi:hypothetical protein